MRINTVFSNPDQETGPQPVVVQLLFESPDELSVFWHRFNPTYGVALQASLGLRQDQVILGQPDNSQGRTFTELNFREQLRADADIHIWNEINAILQRFTRQ